MCLVCSQRDLAAICGRRRLSIAVPLEPPYYLCTAGPIALTLSRELVQGLDDMGQTIPRAHVVTSRTDSQRCPAAGRISYRTMEGRGRTGCWQSRLGVPPCQWPFRIESELRCQFGQSGLSPPSRGGAVQESVGPRQKSEMALNSLNRTLRSRREHGLAALFVFNSLT